MSAQPVVSSQCVDDLQRQQLRSLFDAALTAVDPMTAVPQFLPNKPKGRTIVIGAGKASARMALALEQHWDAPLEGMVVTRYDHGEPCQRIRVVQAGHPVPDAAGAQAAQDILASVSNLNQDDLVIALMSGGGSSLLSLPASGLSLQDKRDVTQALLKCGATISEMNCVRKHLSSIKGGKLGRACGLATVHTLVLSDVPGDDPRTVASGPTLDDDTTAADALAVLERYRITPPVRVYAALKLGLTTHHTLPLGQRECHVIATAQLALDSAAAQARSLGLKPIILGNAIEGEARHVGAMQAGIARQIALHSQPSAGPAVLLSGGETTVTVQGSGRGGRNAEFLLAHALACKGLNNVWGLAADTDGIDGSESNAGAMFGPDSLQRAKSLNIDGAQLLSRNDAFSFFDALGDLITTGPTRTNVNDFRATLVL
jgi:glycerate 2-kinase